MASRVKMEVRDDQACGVETCVGVEMEVGSAFLATLGQFFTTLV